MDEQGTIIGLRRLGWSERRIARESGYHRATIRRIVLETTAEAQSVPEVATDSGPRAAAVAPASRSLCEPHRRFIEAEAAKGRNAVAIYQDLVEHHGYSGAYNAVKRFVSKVRPNEPTISCRFETPPAQEAQVDYGEGAPTREPRSGKYRKPRLFVMTLSNSRHAFRKTVWKSSKQVWCELHEEAFAYFGGAPNTIRLDNLKEGVLEPDVYDPLLNPLYVNTLDHYGVVALPCRPYAPDLKGKVESAIGHTQRTALKGRRFESIEEQNVFLSRWNDRWASTRIHGTTKRQVREMFEAERSFLLPLPLTRFEYYRIGERRVHFDGHVEVDGAYYSAPPRYAGAKVIIHVGRLWLRIIDAHTHECVREHIIALCKGQRRTLDVDRPAQTPPAVEKLAARIALVGPACAEFARAIVAERGALAARSLFGMLDLLRRYDRDAVESACSLAVEANTSRLRFVRLYLAQQRPTLLKTQHEIIPEIATYTTHFMTLTQGDL
ncbi:MAG: IS21 family transposase [Chloroflexi bacterium]|nr:IS21 family transposase [Chloroflexota bacterium]